VKKSLCFRGLSEARENITKNIFPLLRTARRFLPKKAVCGTQGIGRNPDRQTPPQVKKYRALPWEARDILI